MVKRIIISLSSSITVFFIHLAYTVYNAEATAQKWIVNSVTADVQQSYLTKYFINQDYFIGLSFALAISFTVYAVLRFLEKRKKSGGSILGGITLTGALYAGLCFFTGCCGSPMLAVYLGFFGASFLGFIKPLSFILTAVSVAVGLLTIELRKDKKCSPDCTSGCIPEKLHDADGNNV